MHKILNRCVAGLLTSSSLLLGSCTADAQTGSVPKELKPYTSCHFPDDLQIVRVDPLAPGVTARTVDTANGSKQIDMEAGLRIMFAYLFTDFYANVKAEKLPDNKYPELKTELVDNLRHVQSHTAGSAMNSALPSNLHRFEVYGEDRDKLEGGVLGMYLLFDNDPKVVTTVYFLNQEPQQRKFQTIQEYRHLRDQFLETYTGCIRDNRALYR